MPFDLHARGTTTAREVRGGITTFLTMAYILFANPSILSSAGIPFEAAAAGTAAATAMCTLLMGLGANFPVALAPGMGPGQRCRSVGSENVPRFMWRMIAPGTGTVNQNAPTRSTTSTARRERILSRRDAL